MSDLTLKIQLDEANARRYIRGARRFIIFYSIIRSEQGEEDKISDKLRLFTNNPNAAVPFTNVLETQKAMKDILKEGETPNDLKEQVTGLEFHLEILEAQLFIENPVVTRQQVDDFFGSFRNLKSLVLSCAQCSSRDRDNTLDSATIILDRIPQNSRLEQLFIGLGSPNETELKVQDFTTALKNHSNHLKILAIHPAYDDEIDYWESCNNYRMLLRYFGPVFDCISNMSLVKLQIGSQMDLFSRCWGHKYEVPQIFQGLQELTVRLDWKYEMCPGWGWTNYKTSQIENALRLMEAAVETNPTIHTVTFKHQNPQCDENPDWIHKIKNSKVGDIRLLNARAEDVDNFYMRIGSLFKEIESSNKEKESQRPFTVHLSWSDTPINSYKSTCKALYDHLKWCSVNSYKGHIPTKEFGLIEALIQVKESPSYASKETILSRIFFNLSCDPGRWVNTAMENMPLHSIRVQGSTRKRPRGVNSFLLNFAD